MIIIQGFEVGISEDEVFEEFNGLVTLKIGRDGIVFLPKKLAESLADQLLATVQDIRRKEEEEENETL